MKKPWRWTKLRINIRKLLEGGQTPFEIEQLMVRSFDKAHPDAGQAERAMTYADYYTTVTEVAERIKS